MDQYVYVVTDNELGWDCVVGVYRTEEAAILRCKPDPEEYAADPEFWKPYLDRSGMFESCFITYKKLED